MIIGITIEEEIVTGTEIGTNEETEIVIEDEGEDQGVLPDQALVARALDRALDQALEEIDLEIDQEIDQEIDTEIDLDQDLIKKEKEDPEENHQVADQVNHILPGLGQDQKEEMTKTQNKQQLTSLVNRFK